ncbi:hypothetical protein GCM10007894_10250 [Paraferrimonas haliotis]|uniref:Uncharacterized protein n=1 Tax=Paraferrimonas haliotis TaxID=2013866 RepID=A0AA37TNT1_9GAMM|nr:hypothetical protein GCM10007894_10250 [Paraferrimonas haliotis]
MLGHIVSLKFEEREPLKLSKKRMVARGKDTLAADLFSISGMGGVIPLSEIAVVLFADFQNVRYTHR